MTPPPHLPSLRAVNGVLFGLLDGIPVVSALLVLEHDGHIASAVQVASCDVDDGASGYGTSAGFQRVQSGDLCKGGEEVTTSHSLCKDFISHNSVSGATKTINAWIKVKMEKTLRVELL